MNLPGKAPESPPMVIIGIRPTPITVELVLTTQAKRREIARITALRIGFYIHFGRMNKKFIPRLRRGAILFGASEEEIDKWIEEGKKTAKINY